MHIDFPFHIDSSKRTAITELHDHCLDLIIQLLLTREGERVNRPTFGSLLAAFEPNRETAAGGIEAAIQNASLQFLSDRIQVISIDIKSDEEELYVHLKYWCLDDGREVEDKIPIERPLP